MSFVVTCPSCGKRLQADTRLAGKRVPCPRCGARFKLLASPLVPSLVLSSAPSAAAPQPIMAEVIGEPSRNPSLPIAGIFGSHKRRLPGVLMLFVGVGIMIAITTVLLIAQSVTAAPDQHNFKQTLRWAEYKMGPLASLAAQRNNLVLAEKKVEIMRDLQPLVGQTVEWSLIVTDVTADAVYLEGDHQWIVFRQAAIVPSAHWERSMYEGLVGTKSLAVPIGAGISAEEAKQLTTGDQLLIRAQITEAEIAHQDRHLNHLAERQRQHGYASGYAVVVTVSNVTSARSSGMDAALELPSVAEVAINDLVRTYKNELAGKELYGGKQIKVTGKLGFGGLGNIVLLESPTGDTLTPIRCSFPFDDPQEKRLVQTRKEALGIIITIVGTCSGPAYPDHIGLKNCRLITPFAEIERQINERKRVAEEAQRTALAQAEQRVRREAAFTLKDFDDFKSQREGIVIVEFRGSVKQIVAASVERITVHLESEDHTFTVRGEFQPHHKSELTKLHVGDTVTIRGERIRGWGLADRSLGLDHCVLVQ